MPFDWPSTPPNIVRPPRPADLISEHVESNSTSTFVSSGLAHEFWMNWGELAGLEASGRRIMGHNGVKEAAMVDDYTAKMTELIELMRLIGNDTQQCEVKECKRKISSTITDTLSAFSNGSGGWIILGLSEKNGFTPVEGFDARAMQEALSFICRLHR